MEVTRDNRTIWDDIYASGHMLWYPYELVVRIIGALSAAGRLNGVILDHGCGSGNHLEFLFRKGLSAVGTEIAPSASAIVRARFAGAKLATPEIVIFDPSLPLPGQLPAYDHVLAWGSVHYNRRAKTIADIRALIDGLPSGGMFMFTIPSLNDVALTGAERDEDGTFRIVSEVSNQQGAVLTAADDEDELVEWCKGIAVEDTGRFSWDLGGSHSEFMFLVGAKP